MDALTWTALIAASGSLVAVVSFWINRGRAEAEATASATTALQTANALAARVEFLSQQLNSAQLEFARNYATHKDLAAAEGRVAEALNGLRAELRGFNQRIDRVLDGRSRTPDD